MKQVSLSLSLSLSLKEELVLEKKSYFLPFL